MKKLLHKGLLLLSGALCFGVALTGAACASDSLETVPVSPEAQTQSGYLHVIESGSPENVAGEEGDACLVVTSGEFWRKTGRGWVKSSVESYTSEEDSLVVTYTDGSVHTYSVTPAEAGHEHTYGTVYTVYEARCVVPGIGVSTCTECGSSIAVILPAVAENHSYNKENYGKCDYCGHLESGAPGFEVDKDSNIEEVFDQVEDGDTIELSGDLTITDPSAMNISGKNITWDIKGNDVAIEKHREDSTGFCFDGGSLTITDSNATSESEERGKFTLNVAEADNQSARDKGTYAMRVNNADLRITNIDFEIINSTENNSHAMYVTGGKIDVESDAKIIVKQGENADGHQTEGGYGIYISEGAEMNLNATTVESEGPIFPFVVGNNAKSEEKTVLNINEGTEILYHNSACSYGAFDVYPNGVVNMDEGSKIVIDGKSLDPDKAEGSNYSNAMAFVVIGGGEVNFNGEIDLGLDLGMAYGFFILNNYWYDDPEADLPSHIILDAHCTIGANAKIIGSTEGGGGVRFFAAQRNGTEKLIFSGRQIVGYSDLELETGDAFYSVIIENGATITLDGVEAKKGVGTFAMTDDGYPGTGKANDHLGWFTSDAIKDMREFS